MIRIIQHKDDRDKALVDAKRLLASGLFDSDFYRLNNPDLDALADDQLPLHFVELGGAEGRRAHPLFDCDYYLQRYPAASEFRTGPLMHYIELGSEQGCDPHPLFDHEFYTSQCGAISDGGTALSHYINTGTDLGLDPHPLFSTTCYRSNYPEVKGNPLAHYVVEGYALGYNPGPHFDEAWYRLRYPDVNAANINPLVHYVTVGETEGRTGKRFATIGEAAAFSKRQPFVRALERLRDLPPFTHVIALGALQRGGTERTACSYLRALSEQIGIQNVLFAVLDSEDETCVEWLPPGTRRINLLQMEPTLSVEERTILLLDLLLRVRPKALIGYTSHTFWQGLDNYLALWRREIDTTLVGYLGGYESYVEFNEWGFHDGALHRMLNAIDVVITDNVRLAEVIRKSPPGIPDVAQKIFSFPKPLSAPLHDKLTALYKVGRTQPAPRKVLWASRITMIKNPDMLVAIARELPDVQFEVYGYPSPPGYAKNLENIANVNLNGEFGDFADIPLNDMALLLHTSKADGMANVILEAACAGLPIVCSNVGAASEIVSAQSGWLIPDHQNVSSFAAAIREALADPEEAHKRALVARRIYLEGHRWSDFCRHVRSLPIWKHADARV